MTVRYPPEPIDEDYDDGTMQANVNEVAEAVVGHKIVSFERNVKVDKENWYGDTASVITLDNGKRVELFDSSDCCAFTELEDFLLNVDKIDHIITGVGTTDGFTTWHIYADGDDVLNLKVAWSSGNPFYYGYGFYIRVK